MAREKQEMTAELVIGVSVEPVIFPPGDEDEEARLVIFLDDCSVSVAWNLKDLQVFPIEDDEISAVRQAELTTAALRDLANRIDGMVNQDTKKEPNE